MPGRRRRQVDPWAVLNQLINEAKNYGINQELIDELQSKMQAFTQQTTLCNNIDTLRSDLKKISSHFGYSFYFPIYFTNNASIIPQLKSIIHEIERESNRILYSRQLENKFSQDMLNLCHIIKKIINALYDELGKSGKLYQHKIDKAINNLRKNNTWMDACLNNSLLNLINNYVNCTKQSILQSIPYSDNILDFVQNITGIPTNIIQHKPVKYVRLEFIDHKGKTVQEETIETIDLFYSLTPFTLYSLGQNRYFIFIPKEDSIPEKRSLPNSNIIVPLKVRLREISTKPVELSWSTHRRSKVIRSKVFEISSSAISQQASFYTCRLGFVPIMMNDKCENQLCNARSRCYDPITNSYKHAYKINDSYIRTYNISTEVEKEAVFYSSQPIGVIINIDAKPLLKVSIDSASVVLSMDSVIFTPRESWKWLFIREPKLKVRIKGSKLGLDLYDTKAFVLRFDKEFLRSIITSVLQNNNVARSYICIKYKAYTADKEYIYDKVLNAANDFLNSNGKCDITDELINYAMKVFAHTLAHILLTYIAAKLQVEYYRTLDYYYKVNDNEVIVSIYELGDGGLGLLDKNTLSQVFADILSDLYQYSHLMHDKCENKLVRQLNFGNNYVPKLFNQHLVNLWNKYISNAYSNYNIIINAQTLRRNVLKLVSDNVVSLDEVHEFMQFIPICMDGCNYCVMLEKGCSTPLDQLIEVSRTLLYYVLEALKKEYDKAIQQINNMLRKPSKDREEFFLKLLNNSSKVKIMTYVIDNYFADKLIERVKAGDNANIMLILNKEKSEELKDVIKRLVDNGVQVSVLENLHAKVYIFDDSLVIEGSANLTRKGLIENEETLELKSNLSSVKEYVNEIDKAWSKSVRLT